MSSTKATSRPSPSSDLEQALLALKDLVEATPMTTEPLQVSALHQAKMVLRKYDMAPLPS
jgi:hypothetical protein